MDIMKWRNEQMYHLRQAEKLTEQSQDSYFKNVVSKLFEQEKPNQLLFSFLKMAFVLVMEVWYILTGLIRTLKFRL
ncbi:putative ribosomal-protein-serine acetyltransferase [Nonlabens ulvanivorans]|nr:putative ribosomal-protein-serine acetyltransferase [Nonlabens ulvanivorans]